MGGEEVACEGDQEEEEGVLVMSGPMGPMRSACLMVGCLICRSFTEPSSRRVQQALRRGITD